MGNSWFVTVEVVGENHYLSFPPYGLAMAELTNFLYMKYMTFDIYCKASHDDIITIIENFINLCDGRMFGHRCHNLCNAFIYSSWINFYLCVQPTVRPICWRKQDDFSIRCQHSNNSWKCFSNASGDKLQVTKRLRATSNEASS